MKIWFAMDLWKRVLIGLVIGGAIGLGLRYGLGVERGSEIAITWFKPLGDAFINLIRMLVVPLIFTTLISGVLSMGDPKRLGSLGGRAICLYLITGVFAVSFGLLMGGLIQPGAGFDLSTVSEADLADARARLSNAPPPSSAVDQIISTLVNIVPVNPIDAMARGDVLPVIFFAIMIGIAILLTGEAGQPLAKVINSGAEVMMRLTMIVMEVAPYGVLALMVWVMGTRGLVVLEVLGKLTFAHYTACILHMLLIYGFMVKGIARMPLLPFIRGIADPQAVAFSTSSSAATLPVTIAAATKNLGISKPVASSLFPLGNTLNMDGTALYQGLVAMFAAQALGMQMDASMYFSIILMATLVSIGAAGIPSVSLFLSSITLSVVGVSPENIVLIIAVLFPFDRLLDMMRTVTNITGDFAVATVLAKADGELDHAVFLARDPV